MKKTLLAALLAALMLVCTGCASFLERDYSVVQPHSSTYYESEDRSVLRAESYQDLVNDLMLLLTGGRKNKGLGKITGGLGKIYNITGFLSDLLSYSRVMALGLSGAVVGQVVNKIATMATGIPGVILFVAVFLFGHIFNLAIGLLGAYVHTSRLQYIEFFGRFFEDGGHPFKPLENNTKFVEIVKED